MKGSAYSMLGTKKKAMVLSMMFVLLIGILPLQLSAQSLIETGAKTPPPPATFGPLTSFDPNFDYLDFGHNGINNEGDGTVSVYGDSQATQDVDAIGVKLEVQKWTGSQWIDYDAAPDHEQYNLDYTYDSVSFTVETGYYYRAKSKHWADEGSIHEEGELYSNSILVN